MFKEQTFSSYKRELDFSKHASTRINPKPIFIIPALSRSNHACINPETFFPQKIIHHTRQTAKVHSLISKTPFLFSVDQDMHSASFKPEKVSI